MEITASLPLMVIRHDAALACTRLPSQVMRRCVGVAVTALPDSVVTLTMSTSLWAAWWRRPSLWPTAS